jgi:hypothetical protein
MPGSKNMPAPVNLKVTCLLRCAIALWCINWWAGTATCAPSAAEAQKHWAFQPVRATAPPKVKKSNWLKTPVDNFILARLENEKLQPSPEAERATLIRRLSFDLIGLPPSIEEVREFMQDKRPDAYELLVERLLESPHYGERWGQHWLDVAGYADSNGYFDADSDRPLAWKYRDYVIRAVNSDKAFDEFVREQIAGDEMAGYKPDGDITPEMVDKLVATHFLRNGPDGTGESDGNAMELTVDRFAVIESTMQILGSSLLGITVQCAKCHDHKFEQFTQADYYGMQALLRPAYNPEKWLKPKERLMTIGTQAERAANKARIDAFEKELKALKESQEGLLKPLRKLLTDEKLQRVPQEQRAGVTKALETKEKDRNAQMKELLKKFPEVAEAKDADIEKRFPDLATSIRASAAAIGRLEKMRPTPLSQISVLVEPSGPAPTVHVLARGNYAKPAAEVSASVPGVFGAENFSVRQCTGSSGRRLAFAKWVTSPQHPTFARLAVNRIWQQHFGIGLVATPENFGLAGAKPTHPELLDYLATSFVRSGWSTKALHRLIVNSATYRQSGELREPEFKQDQDNRLLWRYPMHRLGAEAVRDAILATTGEIDRKMAGPFVPKAKTADGEYVINENEPGAHRRSIYLQQRRTNPVTFLDVFDAARMNPNCVQRIQSTVPLQSLSLLNSSFIRTRSKVFAEALLTQKDKATGRLIARAFQMALGRGPSPEELEAAQDFLSKQLAEYSGKANQEPAAWTDFCQMLFASNAFLYVE